MTEKKPFSPADLIMKKYQDRQQSIPENLPDLNATEEAAFQEKIIAPLIKAIKESKPKVIRRSVARDEEVEGRAGYTPRYEKVRAVRDMLRGFAPSKMKVDTETRGEEVIDRIPREEVHIHLMVDVSQYYVNRDEQIRRILALLRRINDLTPAELNEKQDTTVIKKVHVTVDAMVSTVDGHRIFKIGTDVETSQLLKTYAKMVARMFDVEDFAADPRLTVAAKIADVYSQSYVTSDQQKKEPHMVHARALIFGQSGFHKERYTTAEQYQIITI